MSILIFALLLIPSLCFSQSTIGKITFVMGESEIIYPDAPNPKWSRINLDIDIKKGAKIRTGAKGKIKINTVNREVITIYPRSIINLKDTDYKTTIGLSGTLDLSIGTIRATLPSGKNTSFRIKTLFSLSSVTGTDFAVKEKLKRKGRSATVYVFEGTVDLVNTKTGGDRTEISAMQKSTVTPSSLPSKPVIITDNELLEFGIEPELPATEEIVAKIEPEIPENEPIPEPVIEPDPEPEPEPIPEPEPEPEPEIPITPTAETQTSQTNIEPQTNLLQTNIPQTNLPQTNEQIEEPKKERPKPEIDFNFNADIGPMFIDNSSSKSIYSKVILMPELLIGKFGISLYLPLYLKFSKPVVIYNRTDWDFGSYKRVSYRDKFDASDFFIDFFKLFYYIRWSQKGDKVYVKLGSIDSFTIGDGFIMNGYSNMLEFPLNRKLGFEVALDFNLVGFEYMAGNLFNHNLYAFRLFGRPFFKFAKSTPAKKIYIGTYFFEDLNAANNRFDPMIAIWGMDLGTYLLQNDNFNFLIYTDFARFQLKHTILTSNNWVTYNNKTAWVAGFKGNIFILTYKLEYRLLYHGFPSEYFNIFYDTSKSEKLIRVITENITKNGLFIGMGLDIKKYFSAFLSFWENFGRGVHGDNLLHIEMELKKGAIPKFNLHGKFTYDRYHVIGKYLFRPFVDKNTTIKVEGVYSFDKVDLAFVYKQNYAYDENGVLVPVKSISIDTRMSF